MYLVVLNVFRFQIWLHWEPIRFNISSVTATIRNKDFTKRQ